MRRGIPLVAARAWSGARGPEVDASTVDPSIDFFSPKVPAQNLDRQTSFTSWSRETASDPVALGHGSKGMNYTLDLSVTGPFSLSSTDVTLSLSKSGSLVFNSDGYEYPLRSVSETDGFDAGHPGRIWVNVTSSSHQVVNISTPAEIKITGDVIGGSRVWVNGTFAGRFEVYVFGGRNTQFSWSQMAFVAPLETLSGGIQKLSLAAAQGNGTYTPPPVQNMARSTAWARLNVGGLLGIAAAAGCLVMV